MGLAKMLANRGIGVGGVAAPPGEASRRADLPVPVKDSARRVPRERLPTDDIADGRIPAGWDAQRACDGCGPVWLWPSAPDRLQACPWCASRRNGVSIPRPRVRCEQCKHYEPDPINPPAGVGDCLVGAGAQQRRSLWPGVDRQCGAFRSKTP